MKVIFLITTYFTLYLVFMKFKATYDSNHDTFRAEFLVIPAAGLAVLVNHEFSLMEVRGEGMWWRGRVRGVWWGGRVRGVVGREGEGCVVGREGEGCGGVSGVGGR